MTNPATVPFKLVASVLQVLALATLAQGCAGVADPDPAPNALASVVRASTGAVPSTSTIDACNAEGGKPDAATLCKGEDWWLPSGVSARSDAGHIYVNGLAEIDGERDVWQDGDKHDMSGHGHMWRPYWGDALAESDKGTIDWTNTVRTQLFNYRERFCTYAQDWSASGDPDTADATRNTSIALLPPLLRYGASVLSGCTVGTDAGYCAATTKYCTDAALASWDPDELYVTLSGSTNGSNSPAFMASLVAEAGATAVPPLMARRFLDYCDGVAACKARLVADPSTPTQSLLASATARVEAAGSPCDATTTANCQGATPTYLDCSTTLTDDDGARVATWNLCTTAQAYLVAILHTYGVAAGSVTITDPGAAAKQAALRRPTYDYTDPDYLKLRALYLQRWAELLVAEGQTRATGVGLASGMSYEDLAFDQIIIGSIDLNAESGLVPFEAWTLLGQGTVDAGLDALIGAAADASSATGLPVGTWNFAISQGGAEFAHAVQTARTATMGLAAHSAITMFSYDFLQFVPSQSYDATYEAFRPTRDDDGARIALGWSNLHTDIEAWENTANAWGEYRWLRASALAAVAAGFTSLTIGGCGLPSEGRWSEFETGADGENAYSACLVDWADIEAHGAEGFFDWLVATVGKTGAESNEAYCNLFQSGIPVDAADAAFFDRDLDTDFGLPSYDDAVGQLATNNAGWQRTPRVTHWGHNCTLDMTRAGQQGAPVFAMSSGKLGGTQQSGSESVFGNQTAAAALSGDDACETDAETGKLLCAYEGRKTEDQSGNAQDLAFLLADDFVEARESATDATTLASRVWVVKVMFAPTDPAAGGKGTWELAYRTRMPGRCLGWRTQEVAFEFDADATDYTESYGEYFAGKRGVATATFRLNDAVFTGNDVDGTDLVLRKVDGESASFLTLRVIDAGDCSDTSECMTAWQGAVETEVCDGADNDCNGAIDDHPADGTEYYVDGDRDGFGGTTIERACGLFSGLSLRADDCNDNSAATRPGGTEVCNGRDDDCDGAVDEGLGTVNRCYRDTDGDGYGVGPARPNARCACPAGYAAMFPDLAPSNPAVR